MRIDLRPGNPNDIQTITILGLLFALVTIIGGIHPEIYRHLPNPGLRLGCFNFVIVPVLAWIIVRILGGMAVATSFEKAFGKTPSPTTTFGFPRRKRGVSWLQGRPEGNELQGNPK